MLKPIRSWEYYLGWTALMLGLTWVALIIIYSSGG